MSFQDHWYQGNFIHTPNPGELQVLENTLVHVDATGTITAILNCKDEQFKPTLELAREHRALTSAGTNQLFIPGMIDLHIHAPQWPQLGKALQLPLEQWLQQYTFPLEARYSDIHFADRVYRSMVKALLSNGTTTAVYFATIHEQTTTLLASTCLALGQRAFVGRVAMDDPSQCPDYYRDADAVSAIAASERNIRHIRALENNSSKLVKPVITPRFIPSCSDDLLHGLGELAATHQCHVQTHCSESDWEHQYVLNRLNKTDTQALADFGLLGKRTILAHSNFITDADMCLIKDRASAIAHCPLSNSYFANSVFPLRLTLNKSIHVGLGTDIAGGHSASMFNACQQAVASSRMLESGVNTSLTAELRGTPNSRISFLEAFYLATSGGAQALDIASGYFAPGRQFDALLLELDNPLNRLNEFNHVENWEDLLGCIVYNTQPCNIEQTWVAGRTTQ